MIQVVLMSWRLSTGSTLQQGYFSYIILTIDPTISLWFILSKMKYVASTYKTQ